MRELLSDIAIHRGLASLQGWSRKGDTITKTYQFKTFPAAISFINRVAEAAETADHHPDIDIRFTKVTCTLSTHDAGGITQSDLDLAGEIEFAEQG
ncbi:MAG: 4a-hydroxytetrahydrobiopterin dehydratase [Gemmatimonadaceae bacterium]